MVDPTEHELQAIMNASDSGGDYLDSIKKTDFAVMSEDEWMTFIEAVCTGYTTYLGEVHAAPITQADLPY